MPAPGNKSQYLIPANLAPDGICCIQVPVPDDVEWRAQFLGALWRLSLQTNYERDAAHSGKVVAARWREVWTEVNAMGCCNDNPANLQLQISAWQINNFQTALAWTQIWIEGTQTISVDYREIPDTYSTDAGDVGDEILQRQIALCIAAQGFLHEIMNYMESWLIANFDEAATVAGSLTVGS